MYIHTKTLLAIMANTKSKEIKSYQLSLARSVRIRMCMKLSTNKTPVFNKMYRPVVDPESDDSK
jgi:hypothetical protein